MSEAVPSNSNFITDIIDNDLASGKNGKRVATRFPPEPNGYLHIGHVKAINLNFGIARDYPGAVCHLRFDDTNPTTEDIEYVNNIQNDIRWLGFDWKEHLYFASDYFEQLYDLAVDLIKAGKAYVDSQSEDEIRTNRGTVTQAGTNSRFRDRSIGENLDLFQRMREGEFPDGSHVLRAKIDMASNNMLLRDPVLYRIKHAHHYRTGDDWCIYPLYDFAHPLSDAIEGITHSLCSLEFDVHRPLYDWLVEAVSVDWNPRPYQYEFARLNLDYTIMSKRKLLKLVQGGYVDGWDDPRMPTVAGMRRRGYTPEALQAFSERVGVAKANNQVEVALLEYSIRDDLNHKAPRVMCVLDPLKVVITNYPEGKEEQLEASYWPHDVPNEGSRIVPFTKELFIDRKDFRETPPKGFFRLSPGAEVRLRYGYIIKCHDVIKDDAGEVVALHCTYDPDTRSGEGKNRKVKGTIHWLSAAHAVPVEVRLYDRLFKVPNPDDVEAPKTFLDNLNPESKKVYRQSLVEPSVAGVVPGTRFQFERHGYFIADQDSTPDALIFNRTVTLRDTWARQHEAAPPAPGRKKKKPKQEAVARRTEEDVLASLNGDEAAINAFHRYKNILHLDLSEAEALASDPDLASLFEATLEHAGNAKTVAGWVVHTLPGELKDRPLADLPFGAKALGNLLALIEDNTISNRIGKDVLAEMMQTGADPATIVEEKGWKQVSDVSALSSVVTELLNRFPDKVEAYRSGKKGLMGFFVGQVMRETEGKANPQVVQGLLEEQL